MGQERESDSICSIITNIEISFTYEKPRVKYVLNANGLLDVDYISPSAFSRYQKQSIIG